MSQNLKNKIEATDISISSLLKDQKFYIDYFQREYRWHVPELSYNDLEIKEGGTASNTFLSMVNETFEGDVEDTRRQLLEYCKLDTYAMVKILEKLLQL